MKQLISLLLLACGLQAEAAVYNIRDFGAKNDTTVLSTKAIQTAIDRCSQEGGGQVLVPAGHYKIGTIVLRSRVNLHLEKGAVLFGSTDINDYTPQRTSLCIPANEHAYRAADMGRQCRGCHHRW